MVFNSRIIYSFFLELIELTMKLIRRSIAKSVSRTETEDDQ